MEFEKFHYKTKEELQDKINQLSVQLPLSENTEVLFTPKDIGPRRVANRFVIQPMEGCDGTSQGSPDELTTRRYLRFAKSGAGLIWFEAVAILREGRANPRQLYLTPETLPDFQRLVAQMKETCLRENGYEPVIIMQATHSGRYSKPNGVPEPIIAYNNPIFEQDAPIPKERIITDDGIRRIEEQYAAATKLAQQAGFDGIDVKSCHRYLGSELLSAYERPGEYGGSFENRTRYLRNSVRRALDARSGEDFIVTSRLNIYDGFPYPYGFGVSPDGGIQPDYTEGKRLIGILHKELGMPLLDITIGNPYFNSYVNRPADAAATVPPEHPLEGVARILDASAQIQREFPELNVICSGLSYLRNYSALAAAAMVERGDAALAGFGREAFAYPEFIHDLKNTGSMAPNRCCIACGKCTELMRAGSKAGCVIRDAQAYLELYRRDVQKLGK